MPDKPITVITYAASASLAAIALVYFFNPNYLIDNGNLNNSASARKKNVVGLQNPLNDCFINSVLQALAGLGDLRVYLIRELHRRKLSDPEIYRTLPEEEEGKPLNRRKLLSLQSGEVTQALKHMLDRLNERPIKQKTISAVEFVRALERAFETRLSKDQQDAQELLQIVAERVCDEYHAGQAARKRMRKNVSRKSSAVRESVKGLGLSVDGSQQPPSSDRVGEARADNETLGVGEEAGFPLEGHTQSEIECQHCRFKPKSKPVSFVMLTLSVPQKTSATLNECFDAHFKREIIDDYKCDRCRLVHAVSVFQKDLSKATTRHVRDEIQRKIDRLQVAIEEDPEQPPKDIQLPDSKLAPARKIERYVKLTQFPQILVIHLSRSIFDARSASAKNLAKVSFPERLPLGSLLDRRNYKLLGMISHKGTHNSGHYECFRRQHVYAPFSTPHVDPESGPYSQLQTPNHSRLGSPKLPPVAQAATPTPPTPLDSPERPRSGYDSRVQSPTGGAGGQTLPPEPSSATSSAASLLSDPHSPPSTRPSSASLTAPSPRSSSSNKHSSVGTVQTAPHTTSYTATSDTAPSTSSSSTKTNTNTDTNGPRRDSAAPIPPPATSSTANNANATTSSRAKSIVDVSRFTGKGGSGGGSGGRKKKASERWWRISDDRVKECKTAEVLGMEREVYLLFYEMERGGAGAGGGVELGR